MKCPDCKTENDIVYRCSHCGMEWDIPDAPVWHDAVKEPPKEEGFYIIALDTDEGLTTTLEIFIRGQWLVGDRNQHLIKYWQPLPLPPEGSGE